LRIEDSGFESTFPRSPPMDSNLSCATLMSLEAETKKLPFASGAWHDATAVCRASKAPSLAPDDSEDTCVLGLRILRGWLRVWDFRVGG
jgi:hypothetical protein